MTQLSGLELRTAAALAWLVNALVADRPVNMIAAAAMIAGSFLWVWDMRGALSLGGGGDAASIRPAARSYISPTDELPMNFAGDLSARVGGMHRSLALPAACALAAALAATAGAAKTRTDTVTASVHKTGRSGTALVYKGVVHSKVFGRGRVVEKIYGNLKGTFVITYKGGKVRGSSTARTAPSSGGRLRVYGTYRLTGGTGRYRHISGHGTYSGTSSADLSRASFRQRGKVRF